MSLFFKTLAAALILACCWLPAIGQTKQKTALDYDVAAADAAWCWFSDPRAVYHQGRQERVYFGYINKKGDVLISARDPKSKAVETFVLHERLQVDDHNVPSVLILPDGRIATFYSEHNGRVFMRVSKKPEDIREWEQEQVLPFGSRSCYSHPVLLSEENNRLYMFWRGDDWQPTYSFSDDLGQTWAQAQILIDGKGFENRSRPYLKVTSDRKRRIDFAFTDGHPSVETTNSVYHVYLEKGQFYQTDGQPICTLKELPVQRDKVNKVYDASPSQARAWIADLALDRKGKPIIVYTRFPDETDHRYHYAAWDGTKWVDQELCKAGGWMPKSLNGQKTREPHYSGGIALDHQNPAAVYLSREIDGTFELEKWAAKGRKWQVQPLTRSSPVNNMRPYVVLNSPKKHPILLWMTGDYYHYTQYDTVLRIRE
jgi:hypothetical protein